MTPTTTPATLPKLTIEQSNAVDRIVRFFNSHNDRSPLQVSQELSLGGLAGTGKTLLISWLARHLAEETKHRPCFVAPTGKAAYVLRQKGIPAKTIHGTIYDFSGETWQDEKRTLHFENRAEIESSPTMFVCDESSMVNTELASDLRSHGLPILWVGDHGQLSPVGDDPRIMHSPDIVLETIHRQALESSIVRLALDVRNGIDPMHFNENQEFPFPADLDVFSRRTHARTVEDIVRISNDKKIDQVLCGFNEFRDSLNRAFRVSKGYEYPLEVGDKLICVLNNRRRQLFNGMTVNVDDILGIGEGDSVQCRLSNEYCEWPCVDVWVQSLGRSNWRSADKPEGGDVFDYGYAITTHKAQGSEWPRVLAVDQTHPNWEVARWRYTAYTRAKEYLYVLTP